LCSFQIESNTKVTVQFDSKFHNRCLEAVILKLKPLILICFRLEIVNKYEVVVLTNICII